MAYGPGYDSLQAMAQAQAECHFRNTFTRTNRCIALKMLKDPRKSKTGLDISWFQSAWGSMLRMESKAANWERYFMASSPLIFAIADGSQADVLTDKVI